MVILILCLSLISSCSRKTPVEKTHSDPTRTCWVGVDQLAPFYHIGGPILIESHPSDNKKIVLRNGLYHSDEPYLNPDQVREHIEVVDCTLTP